MSFSARYLPAVLLTILSISTSLWAQAVAKQTSKAPRGSISGRVTLKGKGAEGVVVMIRKSEPTNPYEAMQRATTDQDGFYRIANVAPGNYEISPSAPAFVPSDWKEPKSKSVLVGEDENVENIDFALVRGGVITGKVTDADGRPVIQQTVNIFRVEAFDQKSQQDRVFASGGGQTDDRGIYRVFGLVPGRYKVGAGRSDNVFIPGSIRTSYKQVFHPDVSDQAKAIVIEVGEGTEAKDVDITLGRTLQTFAVAGRVVDGEKGLPVPNLRLGFQRIVNQRYEFAGIVATTNSQGDFVAEGLVPGKYEFYLFPNQNGGMRVETGHGLDIIDQDVNGVTVKLVPGTSLSGVVVIESENKAVLAKLSELQMMAFTVNTRPNNGALNSSARSPISPDGSFKLTGLSGGNMRIGMSTIANGYPPKGLSIARIERDGEEMSWLQGIDMKDGEQLTGLRVVLKYGDATLRGVVNVENGELPPGSRIYVRLTKPGEKLSNFRSAQVDARGHFLIEGLPAGTYEVYATVYVTLQTQPPRTAMREVSVQDGVTTDVTLTVDMTPPQKP
jgi:protocatechuate 3,4-dioxygenase beta subunit